MEKQAILLTGQLKKRGIDATLFIAGVKGVKRSAAVDLKGLDTRYLFHKNSLSALSGMLLRRYCKKKGITHLIAFHFGNARICVEAGVECRLVYNVRSIKFSAYDNLIDSYREVASGSDSIVTNSRNTAELLVEKGVAAGEKVRVIHNAVPLPDINPSFGKNMILYAGSIKRIKDPLTFIKACQYVINRTGDVRVFMAGEGPMRREVENYIRENDLSDNFTLQGEVPFSEIPYKDASVFVNSSLRESSSNSLLEALSFGIPVVATDNPGNSDIISGLEGHTLVPVSRGEEMGEAIYEKLNLGNEKRRDVFNKSREFISDVYSVPKVVDEYISLLENI